nr:MAG TPA: TniQ [Caudoviricetes sp.]
MAEKKGIREHCHQKCRFCPCCIEIDEEGQRRHWSPSKDDEPFLYIPKKGEL